MMFIKRGDAQPILHIIEVPEEVAQDLLEKAAKQKNIDHKEDESVEIKDINVS